MLLTTYTTGYVHHDTVVSKRADEMRPAMLGTCLPMTSLVWGISQFHAVVTVLVVNNHDGFHTKVEDPNVVIGAMMVTKPVMANAVR